MFMINHQLFSEDKNLYPLPYSLFPLRFSKCISLNGTMFLFLDNTIIKQMNKGSRSRWSAASIVLLSYRVPLAQ